MAVGPVGNSSRGGLHRSVVLRGTVQLCNVTCAVSWLFHHRVDSSVESPVLLERCDADEKAPLLLQLFVEILVIPVVTCGKTDGCHSRYSV